MDTYEELEDFYNIFDSLDVTKQDRRKYKRFLESLDENEKELLSDKRNFYLIQFENIGGLVMPIILEATFADGTKETIRYPAETWNKNNKQISKLLIADKEILGLEIDPRLETADSNVDNNIYPPRINKSRFQLFKEKEKSNSMQKAHGVKDDELENEKDD